MINDEREWRISRSGFSIKTGWSDSKKIIAKYPGVAARLDKDAFQEWMVNAEEICAQHNAALEPVLEEMDQTRRDRNDVLA